MKNPYANSPYMGNMQTDIQIQNVAAWLDNMNYTQGIASFWNSNIITELSNGNIEMWTAYKFSRELSPMPWLQSTEHRTLPHGKVFVLVSTWEFNEMNLSCMEPAIVYADSDYIVLGFDDISEYFELLGT